MAKKFNSRGSFRGLKIRCDEYSGEVNIRIPLRELREILTEASLQCLQAMKENRESNLEEDPEGYQENLYRYIKGIDEMVMEPINNRYKIIPKTITERKKFVQEERFERMLINEIVEEAINEGNYKSD
jgi:ABC-type transporter lipoprotein component MlaA